MSGGEVSLVLVVRFVAVALVIGWIPAVIAKAKGRKEFSVWWFYGTSLFLVALIHAILLSSKEDFAKKLERQREESVAKIRLDTQKHGVKRANVAGHVLHLSQRAGSTEQADIADTMCARP